MPVYADLLRAGMLETSDYIRKSGYSYSIVGNRFRLYPQPLKTVKVYIDYSTEMDPFNPDYKNSQIGDPSITGISQAFTMFLLLILIMKTSIVLVRDG